MSSRRSGLSERPLDPVNPLRMGTVIKIGIEGCGVARMMISAIVTQPERDNDVYILLTAHSRIEPLKKEARCELVRRPGQERRPLGTLVSPDKVLGKNGKALGFFALRLDKYSLYENPRDRTTEVATVRNFRECIWDRGTFKVRRLNDDRRPQCYDEGQIPNRDFNIPNMVGKVSGDVDKVAIGDLGKTLQFSYCGLVTRGRDRPLAGSDGLGAPLISDSGALSGIIVGAAEQDTLVYPFEELQKGRELVFVTLGEDWPKVKVAPKAARRARV